MPESGSVRARLAKQREAERDALVEKATAVLEPQFDQVNAKGAARLVIAALDLPASSSFESDGKDLTDGV